MLTWRPRPPLPLLGLAVAAMLGILAADRWALPPLWATAIALTGLLAILVRPAAWTCWLFCAAFFFQLHVVRLWNNDARWLAGVLAPGPRVVHATGIVWSEPEKPATWSGTIKCRFVVKLESLEMNGAAFPSHALANVSWVADVPRYGDRVTFVGSAANLDPPRNPGEFDSTAYEQRLGIYSAIRTRFPIDCQVQSHGHGNPLQAFAFQTRHWVQSRLELDLTDSPEIVAVIDGIVLGLRGESPEDLKTLLQRTGTIHLFVVSGLNIAMLTAIMFFLLKPFGLPRGFNLAVVIVVLAIYTLITGLRTSSVRSTIMATLLLSAWLFDRRAFSVNSLAAAALLLLGWDTNELFAPGFQFSFTLVFIIIVSAGRIQKRLEALAQPDPFLPRLLWPWPVKCGVWGWHRLCIALGVVLASWIGSLIFTVGYFHLFSPGSLVANFLAVPVAFFVLALGLGSIISSAISVHATVLCNNANWFFAHAMLWVLHFSAGLPTGYRYVESPRLARAPVCEISVLDLGDGGATHLRAGGSDWLLDCGDDARYNHTVLPYLRSRGVNQLDGLLLTHGSVKHLGSAITAMGDFTPWFIAESTLKDRSSTRTKFHQWLIDHRRGRGLYLPGDTIRLGRAATVRVLYPPPGLKRSAAADMALVLQLEAAGGTRALFMSASGFATEQWLIENEPDLRADIVIKDQHAHDLSGTADFLAHVTPHVVVCAAPGFGEPVETLDTWEAATRAQGITVFRQDKTGAVQIVIREAGYEVRGFLNSQTYHGHAR
jgi:ComEC/Rec2-related protein